MKSSQLLTVAALATTDVFREMQQIGCNSATCLRWHKKQNQAQNSTGTAAGESPQSSYGLQINLHVALDGAGETT